MKTHRVKIDISEPGSFPTGRFDADRVDETTEADIAHHIAEDEAEAAQDAARYTREVRKRLGLTQQELAERINVSLDTIRNWEQGKRVPTGEAKALFKILDRSPETALAALQ